MIDGLLDEVEQQYGNLRSCWTQPHVLDDYIVSLLGIVLDDPAHGWVLSLLSQIAETTHIQHALAGGITEGGGRRALSGANLAQLRCLLEQRDVDARASQSESRCVYPDSAA